MPPVGPEVELRDYPYVPVYRARLFGSKFHATATDSEWRAAVTLWLKSWDQSPAGSLPNEDVELCRLAEFGRDLKSWRKVKAGALHGWYLCTDGRLYHDVVAEGVLEAFQRRRTASDKGKAGASKRWAEKHALADSTGIPTGTDTGNAPAIAQAMPGDSNRREEKRIRTPLPPEGGRSGKGRNRESERASLDAWNAACEAADTVRATAARPAAERLDWSYARRNLGESIHAIVEVIGGYAKIADRSRFDSAELKRQFREAFEAIASREHAA